MMVENESTAHEGAESDGVRAAGETKTPRIWPSVVIMVIYAAVALGTIALASTNIQNLVGIAVAPLVTLVLLIFWWVAWSRAPKRDRVFGVAIFLAAALWMGLPHGVNGPFLMVLGLPVLMLCTILALVMTSTIPWSRRRWIVAAAIAICAGLFTLVRLEAIGGDLIPRVSWRWDPTPEERLFDEVAPGNYAQRVAELPANVGPHDWTGFRGPNRDGSAPGVVFATDWDESPPRELWRRPIGLGWSSFAVVGDYLFTQEQRGPDELVVCYRADTGDEVWVNAVKTRFDQHMGSGPRATPTYHDGKLYTLGATGTLQRLGASTGQTEWSRNILEDSSAAIPRWGFASSPLIVDDLVIVFAGAGSGASVLAYDLRSGDLEWSAGDGDHGYSSGHLAHFGGKPQVLMISNFGLQSFEPESGALFWEHSWDLGNNARVVQPCLVGEDSLLIGTSFTKGTRKLRVVNGTANWDIQEEWTTRRFRPYFNDLVLYEGLCFGYDGNRLACVSAETGERLWAGPRLGGQVLLLPDMAHVLVLTEGGSLILVPAAADGYVETARFDAIDGKTWNHPVIANGKLFVRNSEEAAGFQLTPDK